MREPNLAWMFAVALFVVLFFPIISNTLGLGIYKEVVHSGVANGEEDGKSKVSTNEPAVKDNCTDICYYEMKMRSAKSIYEEPMRSEKINEFQQKIDVMKSLRNISECDCS